MRQMMDDDDIDRLVEEGILIGVEEAAEIVGVAETTMHNLVNEYQKKAIKSRSKYHRKSFFNRQDIYAIKHIRAQNKAMVTRPKKKGPGEKARDKNFSQPTLVGWAKCEEEAHKLANQSFLDAGVSQRTMDLIWALCEERAFRWSPALDRRPFIK